MTKRPKKEEMQSAIVRALSIRQPWAWLICEGIKPWENRTWKTNKKGALLIHAGKTFDKEGYQWVVDNHELLGLSVGPITGDTEGVVLPTPEQFDKGGIVGFGTVTKVLEYGKDYIDSPWASGPYCWGIANACHLEFKPCNGQLGIFGVQVDLDISDDAEEKDE